MALKSNEKKALRVLKEALSPFDIIDLRLFGSKARGTDVEGSDIDVMMVIQERTPQIESTIDDLIFEINLEHDCLISAVYFSVPELDPGPMDQSPIYKRIVSEGVRL